MVAEMTATKSKLDYRLNYLKTGVLNKNGGIRIDVSYLNLSAHKKEQLTREGGAVSGSDVIISVTLDDSGFPSLRLSNSDSKLLSDFEQSVFEFHQNEIISAAQKLHFETESKQFKISQRLAEKEGFMLSKMERPDYQFSYCLQAHDPDLGLCIIQSCKKANILKAIDDLRRAYADSMRAHYENSDYVIIDSRTYAFLRRELLTGNMLTSSKQRAVSVRTILNECVYVKLSLSNLSFVTTVDKRKKRVLVKDTSAHLEAVNAEICNRGVRIHCMNNGFYNVYRIGSFIKPIIVNAKTISHAIIKIKNSVGGKVSA